MPPIQWFIRTQDRPTRLVLYKLFPIYLTSPLESVFAELRKYRSVVRGSLRLNSSGWMLFVDVILPCLYVLTRGQIYLCVCHTPISLQEIGMGTSILRYKLIEWWSFRVPWWKIKGMKENVKSMDILYYVWISYRTMLY